MQIKFCPEAYFFRLEVLQRTWYLRLGTLSLKSLPEDLCSGVLRPEKIHRPQLDLNPRTLDLEASTLPRDHRGRLGSMVTRLPTDQEVSDSISDTLGKWPMARNPDRSWWHHHTSLKLFWSQLHGQPVVQSPHYNTIIIYFRKIKTKR